MGENCPRRKVSPEGPSKDHMWAVRGLTFGEKRPSHMAGGGWGGDLVGPGSGLEPKPQVTLLSPPP